MSRPDIAGDQERVWALLVSGGVTLQPGDGGYGLWSSSAEGFRRVVSAKQRGAHKRQSVLMDDELQSEIHILDARQRDIIDCITKDYGYPLAVIAPYRADHPHIKAIEPSLVPYCTHNGTMAAALNQGGPFHGETARRSRENCLPIFTSSANLTGTGVKFRVEDIEPEVIAAADLVLDYGLRRYHLYRGSATQLNFQTMQVTRMGICYELISDVVLRHFGWELPSDPGRDVNPGGHVDEFALLKADG